MSLLLRNACQEKLDAANLHNFHCGVSSTGNHLTILGECGQIFVSVSGVQFARTAPSAAEIPLAVDLLESFLMKHKPDFDMYVHELAKFQKLAVIERKTDEYDIGTSGYGKDTLWHCDVYAEPYKLRINEKAHILNISLMIRSGDYKTTHLVTPNTNKVKAGYDHMIAYIAYLDAEMIIKELKAKLSTCEI